jgi:hypothetical protein
MPGQRAARVVITESKLLNGIYRSRASACGSHQWIAHETRSHATLRVRRLYSDSPRTPLPSRSTLASAGQAPLLCAQRGHQSKFLLPLPRAARVNRYPGKARRLPNPEGGCGEQACALSIKDSAGKNPYRPPLPIRHTVWIASALTSATLSRMESHAVPGPGRHRRILSS